MLYYRFQAAQSLAPPDWMEPSTCRTPDSLHVEVKGLHEKCKTASYTQLDMQAKNKKKDLLKKKEEEFVRFHLQNNDKVSDNGRKELRIPIYDKTRTSHPAPDSIPDVEIETPHPRTLRIKFRPEKGSHWASPNLSTALNVCGP